jgi:hypothetical protein
MRPTQIDRTPRRLGLRVAINFIVVVILVVVIRLAIDGGHRWGADVAVVELGWAWDRAVYGLGAASQSLGLLTRYDKSVINEEL